MGRHFETIYFVRSHILTMSAFQDIEIGTADDIIVHLVHAHYINYYKLRLLHIIYAIVR